MFHFVHACRFVGVVQDLQQKQFLQDVHIPELLVFAPGTDFHDHVLYRSGDIILQDKVGTGIFIISPMCSNFLAHLSINMINHALLCTCRQVVFLLSSWPHPQGVM